MNSKEKKLVGTWSTSSIGPGYWVDVGAYYEKFHEGHAYIGAYKFNTDGTYSETWVDTDGYFFKNGNWNVPSKGKVLLTNIIVTQSNNKYSSWNYINRKSDNHTELYKIRVDDKGKQEIVFHNPSAYLKDSDYYKMTIDEYIEKGVPMWYTKQ